MVKAIMGLKGSGKTKTLADLANKAVEADTGNVVYVEKGKTLMFDINYKARLINIEDYHIKDYDAFYGFLAGLIAGNHDITEIFVDSITKICYYDIAAIEKLLKKLEKLSELDNINITITISGDASEATDTIKKYFAA